MPTLSLCMILRDEEEVLARCLDSVQAAVDEILLVDTGSADRTKEIARQYTEKIFDFAWKDDFSAARNYGISKAAGDYWMWLDADDVLSGQASRRLKRLKEELDPAVDVVMMPYGASFDREGRPVFTYYRERILKNCPQSRFQGRVHEAAVPWGRVIRENILVEHRPRKQKNHSRNLRIYETMKKEGAVFSGRDIYYYGRELAEHGQYRKAEKQFRLFLERKDGWAEDRIEASRQLAYCLKAAGKGEEALCALLESLRYDVPRAETCCALGETFMERQEYRQAVYWFHQALAAGQQEDPDGFVFRDCRGYIPAINLCVCYDRMGDTRQAEIFNTLAGRYKPEDPAYLSNREYFEKTNQRPGHIV